MKQPSRIPAGNFLRAPNLSRTRVVIAVIVAVAADVIQFCLGPMGWVGVDQIIDLFAMLAISLAIGFHPLFLPTFVAEFVPGVDLFPTWTACVGYVLARRWKAREPFQDASAIPPRSDVIDV